MITFITPTIGRSTLKHTIESVLHQTDGDWKYIIVFDGVEPTEEIKDIIQSDDRIQYIIKEKTGRANQAGMVRNIAIDKSDTEWVGFVDDDDIILPHYVSSLKHEIELKSDIELVVFRMVFFHGGYLPPIHSTKIEACAVGISFCFKKQPAKQIHFVQGGCEDFEMLHSLQHHHNMKAVLSNHMTYGVRWIGNLRVSFEEAITSTPTREKDIPRHYLN
jgi:glycosyltransferase involved in cell wall biosynthesis